MVIIHPIMSGKHNPTMSGKLRPAIDTMEIGCLWKELEREALSTPTLCGLPIIMLSYGQNSFTYQWKSAPIMSAKLRPAIDRRDMSSHSTVREYALDIPSFVGDVEDAVPNFAMHAIFVRLDVPFHSTVGDSVLDVPNFAMQAIFVRRDVPNPVGVSIRNDYQKSIIYCNPCPKYVKTYFRKQR